MSDDKDSPQSSSDAQENTDETRNENEGTRNEIEETKGDSNNAAEAQEESDNSKYIKLKVVGNDQNGIHFRLKMSTQLLKLKKSYSAHVGIPVSGLRFLFDGKRISDDDTPKQLDMRDDDQIEVYHEQTGGFFLNPDLIHERKSMDLRCLKFMPPCDHLHRKHRQNSPYFGFE